MYVPKPAASQVIGYRYTIASHHGDSFNRIARRYDVGYWELRAANPTLNPRATLATKTAVIIPVKFILPPRPHRGIVVNLAELRLYYFPAHSKKVYTYPIGIGQPGELTPVGHFTIAHKIKNPRWRPPAVVRAQYLKRGISLPKVVSSGPRNPLGYYAMHLNQWNYIIHGTNDPSSVGKRSSAGCIHMYPEDIKAFFKMVPTKTPVTIINQPIKLGWQNQHLFAEVEQPLSEQAGQSAQHKKTIVAKIKRLHSARINWPYLQQLLRQKNGIPEPIGTNS